MAEQKERKKIKVMSMATAHTVKDTQVLQFKGLPEGQEDEVLYEVWGDLIEYVKKDIILDCDITHKDKDGQPVHRVTQMYDEKGTGIRKGSGRGGGRGYGGGYSGGYGKTDEQVRLERISIEGQSAYNGIIKLLEAGKQELVDTLCPGLAKDALNWAKKKLEDSRVVKSAPAAQPTSPRMEEAKPKVEPKTASVAPKVAEDKLNEMRIVAKEQGYVKDEIDALLTKYFHLTDARELTMPQAEKLLELLKKGEGRHKEPTPL